MITVNGTVISTVGQTVTTPLGTLTITSITADTFGYTYTLTDNTSGDTTTEVFTVTVTGHKISDEDGNRMTDLEVTFSVAFPEGAGGDRARAILPRAIKSSHDRLCTVSRTVEAGTPVRTVVADA